MELAASVRKQYLASYIQTIYPYKYWEAKTAETWNRHALLVNRCAYCLCRITKLFVLNVERRYDNP